MRLHPSTQAARRIDAVAFRHDRIAYLPIDEIKPYSGNARTHDENQITVLMASMKMFGFTNPALLDGDNVLIAGHGRVEAARRLGMKTVPVLWIEGLSPDQVRAYRISDNRIAELAGWDEHILAIELQHLTSIDIDFSIEVTGWSTAEIDVLIENAASCEDGEDPADIIPPLAKTAISRPGDLWLMGPHRLLCGSALETGCYERLMQGEKAVLICQDPPWNIAVKTISGSGKTKHREFVMGSGEMSEAEFRDFLQTQLACNLACVEPGAVFQVFIDWRGVEKVITAGTALGLELINVCVWHKGHGSFGSPWRSAHELIVCFRVPGAPIRDRVKMGQHGRLRSNVWEVPGMGSFGKGREAALAMHPTSKPVRLLTEAIRDVTDRGDIVLDAFMGSGSCLIAAHRTGRIARGLELDPLYVDTIVRRWQDLTGEMATLDGDGRSFADIAAAHGKEEAVQTSTRPLVRHRVRVSPAATANAGVEMIHAE